MTVCLCSRLQNKYVVIHDLINNLCDSNFETCNDWNVESKEEGKTSAMISYESDKFIDIQEYLNRLL